MNWPPFKSEVSQIRSVIFCTGAIARRDAAFGRGVGPTVWTYAVCTGVEDRLLDCARSSINSCGHQYDVGVECLQGDILTYSYSHREGAWIFSHLSPLQLPALTRIVIKLPQTLEFPCTACNLKQM